ncbi:neutral zinc metallopeptidase [Planobispora takensis]|nr:neutral zinc metallopeptidase [Planobispora takensis]
MWRPLVVLSSAGLACLLATGTAGAEAVRRADVNAGAGAVRRADADAVRRAAGPVPTGVGALTRNPLYGSGELAVSCPGRPAGHGAEAAEQYLLAVTRCLDASWSAYMRRVGLPFGRPGIGIMTKRGPICGKEWKAPSTGRYCNRYQWIYVLAGKNAQRDPANPVTLHLLAHEYAHHVQNRAGMWAVYSTMRAGGAEGGLERNRRYELQADCLAGVFLGGVWRSQRRTGTQWKRLMGVIGDSGDDTLGSRSHGSGGNRVAWLKRGFVSASPGMCNTWTAPAAQVS